MTVSSTLTRANYNGNGVTTTFAVPFYFIESDHLVVTTIDNGFLPPVAATLAQGSDYTVSGAGNFSGGAIVLAVAPTVTQVLTVDRVVPATQETHYVENDPFPADAHEMALDKLTMIDQQVTTQVSDIQAQVDALVASGDTGQVAALVANLATSAGSTRLGYNSGESGAVTRTLAARLADDVLASDFMTAAQINDAYLRMGTIDCTAALQAMLDACRDYGEVRIPAGRYLVSSTLTVTNKNITIRGDGSDCTWLVYTGTDRLLSINQNNVLISTTVRDIALYAGNLSTSSGYALQIFYTEAPGFLGKTVTIQNVEVTSSNAAAYPYWDGGFWLKNCYCPIIDNCFLRGQGNTQVSTVAIRLSENCITTKITNTFFTFWFQGVLIDGYIEGFNAIGCEFVQCTFGLRNTNVSGGLAFNLTTTFIDALLRCVQLDHMTQVNINGCLMYLENEMALPAFVEVSNCSFPKISNSHFDGGTIHVPVAGIAFDNVLYGDVFNNTFDNLQGAPAVYFDSQSVGCSARGNKPISGGFSAPLSYYDLGTQNFIEGFALSAMAPGVDRKYDFGTNAIRFRTTFTRGFVTGTQRLVGTPTYTLGLDDHVISADTSAGNVTITLPASPEQGRQYVIYKETAANSLTIAHNGNNIDANAADLVLTAMAAKAILVYQVAFGWLRIA